MLSVTPQKSALVLRARISITASRATFSTGSSLPPPPSALLTLAMAPHPSSLMLSVTSHSPPRGLHARLICELYTTLPATHTPTTEFLLALTPSLWMKDELDMWMPPMI
jgi:hypothetical protein